MSSDGNRAAIDSSLNVIHVWFDTLKVKPGSSYVLMPVRWSASLPKPHDFRGFNFHFSVDSNHVTISQFLTQGTATENMGSPFTNTRDTDARFVILGSEPDFSRSVLFYVAVTVQLNPGEKTFFHWKYIEDSYKHFLIDTIIADDGWVAVEAARTAAVTSPDTTMKADSVISVPVSISDLRGTSVRQARLSATVDTSVFDFVAATPSGNESLQVVAGLTGTLLTVDVSSTAPLTGNDVLFNLQLRAKHREDTVCSALTNGSFTALNSEAYLGSVSVWLGQICVFGVKPPAKVVLTPAERWLDVFPNPVSAILHIGMSDADPLQLFEVFDVLGRVVYRSHDVHEWKPDVNLSNGRYHVVAVDREGRRREADVTLQR